MTDGALRKLGDGPERRVRRFVLEGLRAEVDGADEASVARERRDEAAHRGVAWSRDNNPRRMTTSCWSSRSRAADRVGPVIWS